MYQAGYYLKFKNMPQRMVGIEFNLIATPSLGDGSGYYLLTVRTSAHTQVS